MSLAEMMTAARPTKAGFKLDVPDSWKQGRTGVDVVDAAMRELYVTGTMHNRVRMIVASYLTKHMLIDWRIGMRWFEDTLIDWDEASNTMGWQWVAGCGPDAAPYFRVFNPATQADIRRAPRLCGSVTKAPNTSPAEDSNGSEGKIFGCYRSSIYVTLINKGTSGMPSIWQNFVTALGRYREPEYRADQTMSELEALTAAVTTGLIEGNTAALCDLFVRLNSPEPRVVWDPPPETFGENPKLALLLQPWDDHRADRAVPLSTRIDPFDIKAALGNVMLLQPVNGGEDFLYRVYGSAIADASGLEMTGKVVRDVPSPLVSVYLLATYRAALLVQRPLFACHTTHYSIQIGEWDRLILPFADEAGAIDRLLVGNFPRPACNCPNP